MSSSLALFSKTVFLLQTDTTVGILSKDNIKLSTIKQRDAKKPFLIVLPTFKKLKKRVRIPQKFKKYIRRSKKTTIIYPNKEAYRVVTTSKHQEFLKRFGWFYSTSANKTMHSFDFNYIKDKVDIIIYNGSSFESNNASKLFIINKIKKRRIR